MSWDISVFASSSPPPPVEQMSNDWRGDLLGSQSEVRAKITAALSQVDWSDPNWGLFEDAGFSFEFNIGNDEPCDGFMIHARGGGPAVAHLIKLAESTGWYLLDCSLGEWLHHCKNQDAGWVGFQEYRDRMISEIQKPNKSIKDNR